MRQQYTKYLMCISALVPTAVWWAGLEPGSNLAASEALTAMAPSQLCITGGIIETQCVDHRYLSQAQVGPVTTLGVFMHTQTRTWLRLRPKQENHTDQSKSP